MKEQGKGENGFAEDQRQGIPDRILKRVMPNGTVMRRFVAGSWLLKIVLGVVIIILIDNVNDNTNRSVRAVCALYDYTVTSIDNATPEQIAAAPGGFKLFQDLRDDLRKTGARCNPPRPAD